MITDDWWKGFIAAWSLMAVIILGVGLFNLARPRIMDYPSVQETCVVRSGVVENCWPYPQTR